MPRGAPLSGAERVRRHRDKRDAEMHRLRMANDKARARDLETIAALYGTDTDAGRSMLMQVLARHALAMLPDEAIAELAELHRQADRQGV